MTTPAQSVRLQRAALITVSASGVKRSIPFQYNPETVRRTLEPNTIGGRPGSRSRAVRFAGAPVETLTLDCRLSASGGADAGDAEVAQDGIAPALAALALLAYPSTADVLAAQALLDQGQIEVIPPEADELLLVFGGRVLPCEIGSLSIVEQLYDADLTPVLATVTLTLRAVTYSDVAPSNPAFRDFVNYQTGLEGLAMPVYDQGAGGL
jgi:hypothetical protein